MKEFEASGTFWPPSDSSSALPGTVRFQPGNRIHVVLNGAFSEEAIHSRGINVPILNGRLANGAACTILDGFCLVETFLRDENHHRSLISARELIGNVAFSEPAGCKLKSAQVNFSHLNDWFDNPFYIRYKRGSFEKALLSFRPDSFQANVTIRDVRATLKVFCAREIPMAATNAGVTWSYRYEIVIEPAEAQELHWFYEVARSLRRCFIFLVGTGVFTLDFKGYLVADTEADEREIVPYFPVVIPIVTRLDPFYFTCHHRDIRSQFPSVLAAWFRREEELRVVTEGYAEALLLDGASPVSVFRHVVQLLEHFHGILWPESAVYVERSAWKGFLKWLKEHCAEALPEVNSEIKGIIRSRIRGVNNLSFRSRIEELFRKVPLAQLMPLIDNPRDVDSFLERFLPRLEATRNYFTHFSTTQGETAWRKKGELEKAVLQCWAVMTFWLAKALDIDDQMAGAMADKANEAMFLVDRGAAL
jgi:ApeA N-terminal domain 1